MEAAFKVVCNLSNVWNILVVVAPFVLFSGEVEVNLLGEEKLHEEVHQFSVLLQLKVVIVKHAHTACHN